MKSKFLSPICCIFIIMLLASCSDRSTDLFNAIEEDDVNKLSEIIDDENSNVKDKSGKSLLHAAVTGGNIRLVNIIISHSADVNVHDNMGNTPLHLSQHIEVIQELLRAGAKIDAANNHGLTPLYGAKDDKKELLIKEGADQFFLKKDDSLTPLHYAIKIGNLEMAKEAILRNDKMLYVADDELKSTLHHAVARNGNNRLDIIELLLNSGVNVNVKDKFGGTPLHYACDKNDLEVVKKIVESGANINSKNNEWETPLYVASVSGLRDENRDVYKLLEFLLDKNANVRAETLDGYTALNPPTFSKGMKNREKIIALLKSYAPDLKSHYPNITAHTENLLYSRSRYKNIKGPVWLYEVTFQEKKGRNAEIYDVLMNIYNNGKRYYPGENGKQFSAIRFTPNSTKVYSSWVSGESLCNGTLKLHFLAKTNEEYVKDVNPNFNVHANDVTLLCK